MIDKERKSWKKILGCLIFGYIQITKPFGVCVDECVTKMHTYIIAPVEIHVQSIVIIICKAIWCESLRTDAIMNAQYQS